MMSCPGEANDFLQPDERAGIVDQVKQQHEQFVVVAVQDGSGEFVCQRVELAIPVVQFAAAAFDHRPDPCMA